MKRYFFYKKDFRTPIRKYMLGLILFIIPSISYASALSKLRNFFNPLHFNFSMGYGSTYYENKTENMAVFEKDGNHYLYNFSENGVMYLVRWFGKPYVRMKLYEGADFLTNIKTSSTSVSFEGWGSTLPISFSGHIDVLKKLRLEMGGSLYIHLVQTLNPAEAHKDLGKYNNRSGIHYTLRAFFIPSFKLLENSAYTLLLNTQIGVNFSYGDLIKDNAAIYNALSPMPVGIGLTLEKHISEYFSVFGRLMYEQSRSVHKFSSSSSNNVSLDLKNVLLQLGLTINCPEIPRCSIPQCSVTVKHKHSDKAYRGVILFKGKNSLGYRLYNK